MLTDSEINIFLNELNESIYVTNDLFKFEIMINNLKNKYTNFDEILNDQIKNNNKIQIIKSKQKMLFNKMIKI